MLPSAPDALVTEDQYTAAIGTPPTADVMRRIEAASAAVRRACGWHIGPVITQTFTVDGPGGSVLQLPTGRLVNLVALVNAGVMMDVEDSDTGPIDWSHDGSVEFRGWSNNRWHGSHGGFTSRPRGIQVTIEHGYDDYPDLIRLLTDVAQRAIPNGVKAEANGARSVTYGEPGLYQDEVDKLQPFRLVQP